MRRFRWVPMLLVLVAAGTASARAQNDDWQRKWFWGIKGGALVYTMPTWGQVFTPQLGAEWLITAKRSALYVGVSQSVATAESDPGFTFSNVSGAQRVEFNGMRRIQIAILVFPTNGALQPYAGGGFVIETLPNAAVAGLTGTTQTTAQNLVDSASSGGFFLTMVGAQLRMRKFAIFAQAQFSPQGQDFLLRGSSMSFELGLRYALTSARSDDITTRR
jgi:hypothetical protein